MDIDIEQKEYENKAKNINPYIEIIGKYEGMYTKIMHKCTHPECNHEWMATPYSILHSKYGCPKCSYRIRAQKRAKPREQYIKEIAQSNPNVELVGEYINNNTPTNHKCKICGYGSNGEWITIPSHIKDGHGCPVCSGNIIGPAPEYINSIWSKEEYREIFKQYITEEQMKENMPNSHGKIEMTCPYCGRTKMIAPNTIMTQGFSCVCSDGISYPNKFMFNFLEQSNKIFEREKSFDWSNGKIYDFYLPNENCIIECHGGQHYRGWNQDAQNAESQRKNDNDKYEMAKLNGIDHYVIINCSRSDKNYITNNIKESGMLNICNIDMAQIDLNICELFATSNLVKKASDMWNEGLSVKQISEKIKTTPQSVARYLKRGNDIGWCENYTKEEARKRGIFHHKVNSKRLSHVYCKELNRVFVSFASIETEMNMNPNAIYLCCIGEWNTYNKMHWYYLYDTTRKNGAKILGAISLELISEEEASKQLVYYYDNYVAS